MVIMKYKQHIVNPGNLLVFSVNSTIFKILTITTQDLTQRERSEENLDKQNLDCIETLNYHASLWSQT